MKTQHCDLCGKQRHDVQSIGRDANGDPDAPDACFLCRKELEKGRVYSEQHKGYVHPSYLDSDDADLCE